MTRRLGPFAASLTVRRTAFGVLVSLAAALVLGSAIGFAAAADQNAAGDAPASLSLPAPNKGDKGTYTVTLVEPRGDEVVIIEPEREYLTFEWLGEATLRDAQGNLRRAHLLHYDQASTCGDESCRINMTIYYDAVTGANLAYAQAMSAQGGETSRSGWTGTPGTMRFAQEGGYWPLLLCGIRNVFQGQTVALDQELVPFNECQVKTYWTAGNWYRAVSTEMIGGHDAVSFSQLQRGFNGVGGGGDSHFWLSPDLPYVLRIAVQSQDEGRSNQYLVFRLLEFERGAAPLSREAIAADPLPPLRIAPRQPWGPDDTGVVHPFPLSAAFVRARDDANRSALRDFLKAHPDAYTATASYAEKIHNSETQRTWTFYVTDGHEGVATCITQHVKPREAAFIALAPAGNVTTYEYLNCSMAGPYPPPNLVPTDMQAVDGLLARWNAYAPRELEGRAPNGWTFDVLCNHAGCTEADVYAGPSLGEDRTDDGPVWVVPSPESYRHIDYVLKFDRNGNATDVMLFEVGSGSPPGGSGARPPHDPVHAQSLNIDAWVFPTGRYAAATGGLALLAGLVYWLWPGLKLGVAGLFSRVEKDSALDQATRAQLHSLVEANPGIHFQEIVRRSGKGRGTVDHHLRKLVHVGLVVKQDGPGYACFFAKGVTDRRLMNAAPVLKSQGALAVLRASGAKVGSTGLELTAATGLDRGTVSYHLARLQGAALVTIERAGRELRVSITEVGRAALSDAGATAS